MNDYNNIRVLLIDGSARQIMPVMRSLHDLGCHVTTYNASRLDMGYASKYPNKKVLSFCDPSDPEKTLTAIKHEIEKKEYDIVIPLNDFIAILLAKNKEELSKHTRIGVTEWNVFEYASDKLKTMKICMENGIPCPITVIDENDVLNIKRYNLTYPLVVKPRTGYGAIGFRTVNDKNELKEVYNATRKKYGDALVQEYIPQTDLQYKAELFVDKNGEIKSAVVFAKIRWYPLNGGSSTLNVTVDRSDIIKTSEKLLRAIKWRGYADIDFIEDPRDSIAKVMEINPRITGSVKICYRAGVNFTEQIIQDALEKPVTEYLQYTKDIYLRYLHTDILWFLKSKERFRCNPSWFNFKNSSDQIFSLDDPWPFFTYSIQSISKFFNDKKKRKLN